MHLLTVFDDGEPLEVSALQPDFASLSASGFGFHKAAARGREITGIGKSEPEQLSGTGAP